MRLRRSAVNSASLSALVARPSISTSPGVGKSIAPARLSSVVLPQPLRPTSAVIVPASAVSEMPCSDLRALPVRAIRFGDLAQFQARDRHHAFPPLPGSDRKGAGVAKPTGSPVCCRLKHREAEDLVRSLRCQRVLARLQRLLHFDAIQSGRAGGRGVDNDRRRLLLLGERDFALPAFDF